MRGARMRRGLFRLCCLSSAWGALSCAQLLGLDEDFYDATALGGASGSETGGSDPGEKPSLPAGRLVFHRYASYGSESVMHVAELPEGSLSPEIGELYGLCYPLSGALSPDAEQLVLTGMLRNEDGSCPGFDRGQLDLFLLDLSELLGDNEVPAPRRLTNNGAPDEDPSFGSDGKSVYFKHHGHLASLSVDETAVFEGCDAKGAEAKCYGDGDGEQSKPMVTAGDAKICYREGDHNESSSGIYCVELTEALSAGESLRDTREAVALNSTISIARPFVYGEYVYYRRWWSPAGSRTSRIARSLIEASEQDEPQNARFCSDEAYDFTDPAVIGGETLVFASTDNSTGRHRLEVARFDDTRAWDIDALTEGDSKINQVPEDQELLGPHFVAY